MLIDDDRLFLEELKGSLCLNGCDVFIPEDIRHAAIEAEGGEPTLSF